jgi:hypothetical protein
MLVLRHRLGWAVLALLLLATLVAAAAVDRARFPLFPDTVTYSMQAASLAWDLDLAYETQDFDRFVERWGTKPEGLVLQSRTGSGRLTFGKPPLYALVAAPFVRLSPVRGTAIANALLLAAAALLAARSLSQRLGASAPWFVTLCVFASVACTYVLWGEAEMLAFAGVAAAFALAYGGERHSGAPASVYQGEDTIPARATLWRWLAVGGLLAAAVAQRPVNGALALPLLLAAWSLPSARRGKAVAALVCGGAVVLGLSAGLQWTAGGDATGYGGQRQGLFEPGSYPTTEDPGERWEKQVATAGNASWLQSGAVSAHLDPKLLGWNAVYFLAGRNVGILPYFLPLLLGFAAFSAERGRWAIPLAVGLAGLAYLVLLPFNFSGGATLANRYFLPLFAALWFVAARPVKAAWGGIAALAAAAFVYPLWLKPFAYPVAASGQPAHVSDVARRILPYETTQSTVPGTQAMAGGGLWVRFLDHSAWANPDGRLRLIGNAEPQILVGSPQPLEALFVVLDRDAPTRLVIAGEELRPVLLGADGSVTFEVPLGRPRAVHRLWWNAFDVHLYQLTLRLPEGPPKPIALRIEPARDLIRFDRTVEE